MLQMREIRAAAASAAILFLYLSLVLMSGRVDLAQFARLLSGYVAACFFLWAVVGFVMFWIQLFRNARSSGREPFLWKFVAGSIQARWERDRYISFLWPPLLLGVLLASFNAFKQMILPTAGFHLDPLFRAADSLLFLGNDPWRVTHAIFASPAATVALDRAYHGWFLPMSLGVVLCAWLSPSTFRLRTQYTLSFIAVWIGIGSILAFLLPSAGPCYYAHFVGPDASFEALMARLAEAEAATGSKLGALAIQERLLGLHGGDTLSVGAGISAMPSVHNALAALFALAAFRLNRIAGWLLSFYAVVIWIGSIHLGWHYALDGIVAVALTLGIWRVSGQVAERLERPLLGPGAQPAIA